MVLQYFMKFLKKLNVFRNRSKGEEDPFSDNPYLSI